MTPLLGQGALYQINKHRQRWLTELEHRRVRKFVAAFTFVAIVVLAWILRP